jgi:Fe-S-cluster containining protein
MTQSPPELLNEKLESAETKEEFSVALRDAYEVIDQLHDRYVGLNWIHLDCRKNRFWCCYLRVDARAHEIFTIARYVETNFTPEQRDALLERLRQHSDRVKKLSYTQHMATNVACPLLLDGACSAYEVRPFGCRRHHSQRVQACEESFNHPTDLESPGARHPGLFVAMVQAEQSLHGAFERMGYDQTSYELGTALLEALTNPKCWRRWKNKKRAFLAAATAPVLRNDSRNA